VSATVKRTVERLAVFHKPVVIVTVTDNGEGQLVASVEISTDEGAVNGIAFNNVYEEPFVPSPETGDETAIGIFLMMLTVTSIGFIAIKSKKRRIAE
jgi:LPXTG-motif cell wall-anchored protein